MRARDVVMCVIGFSVLIFCVTIAAWDLGLDAAHTALANVLMLGVAFFVIIFVAAR